MKEVDKLHLEIGKVYLVEYNYETSTGNKTEEYIIQYVEKIYGIERLVN